MMDDSNDLFSGLPVAPNSETEKNEDTAKPVKAPVSAAANVNVQPKPAAVAAVTTPPPPAPVSPSGDDYGASSIRVLEGLEPVRMR
ncbi:MAG TPA: DNA topoisomerase IV subunit B, partial [Agrobacterium sp.]|nr:DNA topoisomerase IV subunit B [Agrobacterium sp.]